MTARWFQYACRQFPATGLAAVMWHSNAAPCIAGIDTRDEVESVRDAKVHGYAVASLLEPTGVVESRARARSIARFVFLACFGQNQYQPAIERGIIRSLMAGEVQSTPPRLATPAAPPTFRTTFVTDGTELELDPDRLVRVGREVLVKTRTGTALLVRAWSEQDAQAIRMLLLGTEQITGGRVRKKRRT